MVDYVRFVRSHVNIPLIYNGDVFDYEDFELLQKQTGADSIMTARGAMWNPTIFSPNTLPLYDAALEYIDIAERYQNGFSNSKYCVIQMLKNQISSTPEFQIINRSKSMDAMRKNMKEEIHKLELVHAPYKAKRPHYAPRADGYTFTAPDIQETTVEVEES